MDQRGGAINEVLRIDTLNAAVHSVTKKYSLNSLWVELHRLCCDQAGKLNTLWKELLCHLIIADDDPLLVLTKEHFTGSQDQ